MKTIYCILLLTIISGCGRQDCKGPDLSNNPIVWQGYTAEYKNDQLVKLTDKTLACLKSIDPAIVKEKLKEPYIIITENNLTVPELDYQPSGCFYRCNNTIYMGTFDDFFTAYIFTHEIIHWATNLEAKDHGNIYFNTCQAPLF